MPRVASYLGSAWEHAPLGTDQADQVFEAPALRSQDAAAEGSETVIAATGIVLFGSRAMARFFDEIGVNR
jgi:hypothetical protein